MSILRIFRDLRLNLKVALTSTAVFVSIAAVFLVVLLYYQQEQRDRVLELKQDVLSTLHDNVSRELIHYILQENEQSIALNLANLAARGGVEATWIVAPSMGLVATTDSRMIESIGEGGAGRGRRDSSTSREDSVLVFREGAPVRVYSASGRGRELATQPSIQLPRFLSEPSENEVFFLSLSSRKTVMAFRGALMADAEDFGDLHIHYTLEDLVRAEKDTQIMFSGLILAIFVSLLWILNRLISRIVLRPIGNVLDAMKRASDGDLEQQLRVESQDEMGNIADSFNGMVRELKSSKDEIEEYSYNLERRVEDRTRELRESEGDLRNLKNYLSTVIANVETGVISLDSSGKVITFSDRAGEILGVAGGEAEKRTLAELLTWGETGRLLEFLAPVLSGEEGEVRGNLILRLPEKRRTLSVVASALFGERDVEDLERRRIGTVVVFEDVTKLISSQRLEAWKEAVEKVIHEIKNPLTPISLAAQRIRSAYSEDRENFEEIFLWGSKTILDSVTSLKDLITEFSRFYRLPKVVLRPHSVNDLVAETLSVYDVREAGKVTVVRDLAADLPEIEVDPEQLKRVLLNVVKNAIESSDGGEGQVSVTTSRSPGQAGWVRISIRDDGAGIEDVEKIFEPYYTTKVKGTGLGLIISRQIVEEHGGEIRVRSELGRGTEVDILLPWSGGAR